MPWVVVAICRAVEQRELPRLQIDLSESDYNLCHRLSIDGAGRNDHDVWIIASRRKSYALGRASQRRPRSLQRSVGKCARKYILVRQSRHRRQRRRNFCRRIRPQVRTAHRMQGKRPRPKRWKYVSHNHLEIYNSQSNPIAPASYPKRVRDRSRLWMVLHKLAWSYSTFQSSAARASRQWSSPVRHDGMLIPKSVAILRGSSAEFEGRFTGVG